MDKRAKVALLTALLLVGILAVGLVMAKHSGKASSTALKIVRQCNDGKDNDGDGLIDYPADPGCSSRRDNSELNSINSTRV